MAETVPPALEIDHLVFGAADLAAGTAWMTAALGAPSAGGGKHAAMSTHNALWRVGNAYLEVIAVDPGAPDPGRVRWFSLDDPATRAALDTGTCRLLTWVASTRDIAASRAACAHDPGPVLAFSRDDLDWHLTVPEDGRLTGGGTVPHLIEWPDPGRSPGRTLPEQGLDIADFSASVTAATRDFLSRMGAARCLRIAPGSDRLTLSIRRRDGTVRRFDQ